MHLFVIKLAAIPAYSLAVFSNDSERRWDLPQEHSVLVKACGHNPPE